MGGARHPALSLLSLRGLRPSLDLSRRCPDSSRLVHFYLGYGRGATHTPPSGIDDPSTLPCPSTSRFTQGSESKPYKSECGDQSLQKFIQGKLSPRLASSRPLDQTGEESNLRLLDLPIPDFTWLLHLATKQGSSRLLVQTTSSRTYLRDVQ